MVTTPVRLLSSHFEVDLFCDLFVRSRPLCIRLELKRSEGNLQSCACASSGLAIADVKSRPKREAPASSVRTNPTASREGAFARTYREPVRRERSSRDSWTTSALGSTSASSYRSAAPASVRNTRQPPERQVSDNSRSNTELGREGFGAASSGRGGVFRTQSGPPLRDREDFGFGSSNPTYHDNYRFQQVNGRGPLGRGTPDKVCT